MYFSKFSVISFTSLPEIASYMGYPLVFVAQEPASDTDALKIRGLDTLKIANRITGVAGFYNKTIVTGSHNS